MAIQKDQLIGHPFLSGNSHRLQGFSSTLNESGLHLPVCQDIAQNAAIRGVVVHDEDAAALDLNGIVSRHLEGLILLHRESDCEVKAASNARLTFDPDPSVHHRNQTGGDRKAEASAAILSCR